MKVTGRATYAYEQWGVGQPLYGYIVGATIARGRMRGIDTSRAQRSPGVRLVMTYRNRLGTYRDREHARDRRTAGPRLAGSDFRGPRVDWRDLEAHSAGQLICLTGGPLVGVLTPLIERAADLSNPSEAVISSWSDV